MGERTDDDLADRVSALEATLEELREELEPRRGPLGLPRPPTPREIFRFTDEYAIPAAIAILEANVRTLELLQAVLRGARGVPREDEVRGRATALGRTTVERLDRALVDLQTAVEDADLPRNAEARTLLEEARELNEEVRNALAPAEATDRADAGAGRDGAETGETDVDGRVGGQPAEEEAGVAIDVDAELASIKDEIDEDDEADGTRGGTDGAGDGNDVGDGSGERRQGDGE